jgi:hypothetical protein
MQEISFYPAKHICAPRILGGRQVVEARNAQIVVDKRIVIWG